MTSETPLDLDELERKAVRASFRFADTLEEIAASGWMYDEVETFIKAASPSTVLRLIEMARGK